MVFGGELEGVVEGEGRRGETGGGSVGGVGVVEGLGGRGVGDGDEVAFGVIGDGSAVATAIHDGDLTVERIILKASHHTHCINYFA